MKIKTMYDITKSLKSNNIVNSVARKQGLKEKNNSFLHTSESLYITCISKQYKTRITHSLTQNG